jgi:hypothetical protein
LTMPATALVCIFIYLICRQGAGDAVCILQAASLYVKPQFNAWHKSYKYD